jgi:hypothetical protein
MAPVFPDTPIIDPFRYFRRKDEDDHLWINIGIIFIIIGVVSGIITYAIGMMMYSLPLMTPCSPGIFVIGILFIIAGVGRRYQSR